MNMKNKPGNIPDVIGGDELLAKFSEVDSHGQMHNEPIDGLIFRMTRPVAHDDGHVTEVARVSWSELAAPIVQVHITTTLPGRIRAWGLHPQGTDRLFVASGLVRIVVFDGRNNSPTKGCLNVFTISEKNPALVILPPNLYHGWKNIGCSDAVIINMPDRMYDYESPDALDLPWDSEAAQALVPYRWP
jgi:dTDP-4-dehydrorhamnose 3,5-epimerase